MWPFVVAAVSALLFGLLVLADWVYQSYHGDWANPGPAPGLSFLAVIMFLAVGLAASLCALSRTAGYSGLSRGIIRIKP